MKWTSFYILLLIKSLILISCSDSADGKKTEPGPNTASESDTATTASIAREKKPDAAVQGLKGKVEIMSESIYTPEGGKKKIATKKVFKYDANGNRTELAAYKPDGTINSTIRSTYDANGKLTSEETLLANGAVDLNSSIKTDANGNKIEQQDIRPGGNALFNYKYLYSYDEKGQLLEWLAYRGNGAFFFKYDFKYDDKGNKTEWIRRAAGGSVIGKVIYKYDAKNNLVEETEYDKDGNIKATYTYSYNFDRKGNWTRQNKVQNNKVVEIKEREIEYR